MRSESQSSRSSRHNKRPRRPGCWPAFRERVVLDGARYRVTAWRVGGGSGVVVRPEIDLDAERERLIPSAEWNAFRWSPLREQWERAG